MDTTNKLDTQFDGATLCRLEIKERDGVVDSIHYFNSLAALKRYWERWAEDYTDCYKWVYIMKPTEEGIFVDVWECCDIDMI